MNEALAERHYRSRAQQQRERKCPIKVCSGCDAMPLHLPTLVEQ